MSDALNKPGTLTVERTSGTTEYRIDSGPWQYATFLCWINENDTATIYAPIGNILSWSKT